MTIAADERVEVRSQTSVPITLPTGGEKQISIVIFFEFISFFEQNFTIRKQQPMSMGGRKVSSENPSSVFLIQESIFLAP